MDQEEKLFMVMDGGNVNPGMEYVPPKPTEEQKKRMEKYIEEIKNKIKNNQYMRS